MTRAIKGREVVVEVLSSVFPAACPLTGPHNPQDHVLVSLSRTAVAGPHNSSGAPAILCQHMKAGALYRPTALAAFSGALEQS